MRPRKFEIIHCPKCGYEYLPAEIYVSKSFFGKPFAIDREYDGKIFEYEGSSVDLIETYTCDNCNNMFKVSAKMQFITALDKLENFDEDYVSEIQYEKKALF